MICGLLISLSFNALLAALCLKKQKRKIEYTYDVRALMQDLSTGPGLVKIEYVDRADVLLRSPRHF